MKNLTKISCCTVVVSVLSAGLAFGQGPGGGRPPHGPPPGQGAGGPGEGPGGGGPGEEPPAPPVDTALDKDQDGSISAQEIEEAAESLKALDVNKDGMISEDELTPEMPPGGPGGDDSKKRSGRKPPVPPLIEAVDTDDDGEFSAEEIEAAPESLKQLDQNEDGKLSRMEIRPSRRFRPKKDD